jgi:type IV secretory pathway VirB2 component (pilin)
MKNLWSKKLVSFLHFITLSFRRLFIAMIVVLVGTALLHIYSLITLVDWILEILRGNPNITLAIVFIMVCVPTAAYGLEKSLSSYLQQK